MRTKTQKILLLIELLVVISLCYFPICYRIDALSIRQWDEARNAVNAIEMLQNKNYIVRHYENMPDVWETKPPLLIWLQVISMKVFGFNELAIRFPTVFAAFITVLLLIWYFHKYYQNRYIGYLAALVLVTSQGYIDRHIARTGDHDALLILFLTAIILLYFRYLITRQTQPRILLIIAFLFVLGVFTKSVATFFILPGLLLSTFMMHANWKLFLNKWLYIGLFVFLILVGSYYTIRESMQPGYLNAVWHEELFMRYFNSENHFDSGTFWHYGKNFFQSRFTYWIYFLLPAMVLMPLLLKDENRKFYVYLLVNMIVLFLVISLGSKGLWYDGPLYPLFAVTIAMFMFHVWQYIIGKIRLKPAIRSLFATIVFLLIFANPGIAIMRKVSRTYEYPWDQEYFSIGYFLRDKGNIEELPDKVKIVYQGYNAQILFYVEAVNYSRQKELLSIENYSSIKPNDVLLVSQKSILDSIQNKYHYQVLKTKDPTQLIQIGEPMQP